MRIVTFILAVMMAGPAVAADRPHKPINNETSNWAKDWQVISLTASSEHLGSNVWSGKFTGLNGRNYDASSFYRPTNQPLSARLILAKPDNASGITWILPLAADTGHQAKLYQADPLLSFGGGAAVQLARHSIVSVRLDNVLRLGGDISEQPCYDTYRRQYHCGTGLAWADYKKSDIDRRGNYATPGIRINLTHRF